jgi:hypothetical protein
MQVVYDGQAFTVVARDHQPTPLLDVHISFANPYPAASSTKSRIITGCGEHILQGEVCGKAGEKKR